MNPKRAATLPWRTIEGRTVVIQPRKGEVHEFNEVASLVWELADGTNSIDTICQRISDEFEVSDEIARTDVISFVEQLIQNDLCQKS